MYIYVYIYLCVYVFIYLVIQERGRFRYDVLYVQGYRACIHENSSKRINQFYVTLRYHLVWRFPLSHVSVVDCKRLLQSVS